MGSIEPTAEQLQRLLAADGDASPIVMINLLRYRDRAEYAVASGAEPCSGREAYQRYSAAVVPMLAAVGGTVLWFARVQQTVIAPSAESWDDAILVQYPSRKAFVTMVASPDYQRIAVHRTAALADSRLIATVTTASVLPPSAT